MIKTFPNLKQGINGCIEYLKNTGQIHEQTKWQGVKAPAPMFETYEAAFKAPMPRTIEDAILELKPNLLWADIHFEERVSGIPMNPPPSHEIWPFAKKENKEFQQKTKFTHTYPERFWPKNAGGYSFKPNTGIRYALGDLNDLIDQLFNDPNTRQAYLPIFFPEDTGALHGGRVPCTLGYGIYVRNYHLHITYNMRATDALRHFQDDIYLAWRLADYILNVLKYKAKEKSKDEPIGNCFWCKVNLGYLTFHTQNLHVFKGEETLLNKRF